MDEADRRGLFRRVLDSALWRTGFHLERLTPERRRSFESSHDPRIALPAGAEKYLHSDNPRLLELRHAYAAFGLPVCTDSFYWNPDRMKRNVDLRWFRGDNAYVWQYRQLGADLRFKRYIAWREVQAKDTRGLIQKLGEDGMFGCWVERHADSVPISRDLLDSVSEINFLDRHLKLFDRPQLRVLDIGAGYGRLAYRMSRALPNLVRYDCIDAVPESTFLCEYYLDYRKVAPPARAVPLHLIDSELVPGNYDLALNIHSFPECTYAAISWWISRVKSLRIPWLMIAPNHRDHLLSTEADGSRRDFSSLVHDAGYELSAKELMYDNPAARELIEVHDDCQMLFRLRT